MESLDESYVLLSSMSPKVNKNSKKKIISKKLGKLALRKELRRSSILDKLPQNRHDDVLISSDTTESISMLSADSTKNIDVHITGRDQLTVDVKSERGIPEKLTRLNEVKKWVSEVNAEKDFDNPVEEIEPCNVSIFSRLSTIYGDNNTMKENADILNRHSAVNSTCVNNKNYFRFDEMFKKPTLHVVGECDNHASDKNNANKASSEFNEEVIIINDSYEEKCLGTPIKTVSEIDDHEKLLDELYGNSWRMNREKVLTYSEPKQKKKTKDKDVKLPKTERKPKESITYKNPYLLNEIEKSTDMLRSLHVTRVEKLKTESPWAVKFKGLCDSESSLENLNNESPKFCRTRLNFEDSDDENEDLKLNTRNDDFEKFINKTPRRIRNWENNKENLRNLANVEEIDNIQGSGKFERNQCLDSDSTSIELSLETLDDYDTSEKGSRNKKTTGSSSNFDKEVKNKINELKDNKTKSKAKDIMIKNIFDYSTPDKSTKNHVDLKEKLNINEKLIKKSTNGKKTDLNTPENKSKYFYNESPSPETKLKDILKTLSIDKAVVTPSTNKSSKKCDQKENNFLLTDGKKTKSNLKKNVKYYSTSSEETEDSSDEYYSIKTKTYKNRNDKLKRGPLNFLASLSGGVPNDKCDPSARIYRNTYKTSKTELAKKLFDLYNKNIFDNNIPNDTPLEWNDRMRGTAGFCYCKKITRRTGKVERSARIVLATKILDSADRLRDTLVHEMCHAATWILNEISDGHGQYWKAWANKAMRTFPELPPIKRCHDYEINTKYTYKCTSCGYSIGRHSKSLDIERKRCGYCYGKFEVFLNKNTKNGLKSTPATPKKEVTGFALFVKENYSSVKKQNMNHGDVMKILSKKFGELKTK